MFVLNVALSNYTHILLTVIQIISLLVDNIVIQNKQKHHVFFVVM